MIKKQLEQLKERISNQDFLNNRGLSNEVGIHVFPYNPKDEMIVKDFVKRLKEDRKISCNIIEFDLYKAFLKILEHDDILDEVAQVETEISHEELLDQLNTELVPLMDAAEIPELETGKDILVITGVGDAFPFIRAHNVLNDLQPIVTAPVICFYPGEYNGRSLKLFGKLEEQNYYRAFNLCK